MSSHGVSSENIICKVICFCGKFYTMNKITGYKPRWHYSNFQRHIIDHHINLSSKGELPDTKINIDSQKQSIKTITSFFSPSNIAPCYTSEQVIDNKNKGKTHNKEIKVH